jgi:FAD dependent monooxygenase
MFEKLGISYILLEARDTLESDRGAGIGLQPNGLRILDQLGLVEDIEEATAPLHTWFSYDAQGNLMSASSAMGLYGERCVIVYPWDGSGSVAVCQVSSVLVSNFCRTRHPRIGYPVSFIERRKLLPIMVRRLQRVECVRTSARVASIEETDGHVLVTTHDGLSVTADMVVGADGVRSVVRQYIDASSPEDRLHSESGEGEFCDLWSHTDCLLHSTISSLVAS